MERISHSYSVAVLFVSAVLLSACSSGLSSAPSTTHSPEDQSKFEDEPGKEQVKSRINSGKADFSGDPCDWFNWYSDGECDWFCPDADRACLIGEEPAGESTKYPIVLAHGFLAGPELIELYRVPKALRADGHIVKEGSVPPFSPIPKRAEHLANQIDQVLERSGKKKVNIIAHSMGGLDARYVISSMGYHNKVASLTTISSPHKGSRTADVAMGIIHSDKKEKLLNQLAELIGAKSGRELKENPDMRGALSDLALDNIDNFNENNPNKESVYYQSYAGVSNVWVLLPSLTIPNPRDMKACNGKWLGHEGRQDPMDPLLKVSAKIVSEDGFFSFKPNDGLVTVDSAKGQNLDGFNFQGCIPADHADQVGQFKDKGMNEHTGFDHIRFYRNIAYDLSERGL